MQRGVRDSDGMKVSQQWVQPSFWQKCEEKMTEEVHDCEKES